MRTNTIAKLLEEGMSIIDISKELSIPVQEVLIASKPQPLFDEIIIPEVLEPVDIEKKDITETLKDKVNTVAIEAIDQISKVLKDNQDATDLSKLSDSITKMHTTFFKTDPGTTINLHTAALNQFRGLLRE